MLVMQTRVVTKNNPGMMISHQLLDNRARSAMLSMLPQETVSTGSPSAQKAESGFRTDGRTDVGNYHEHDGRNKIRQKMAAQNVEKAAACQPSILDIFAGFNLVYFCANHLGNAHPTGEPDDKRDGKDIGLP